MQGSIEHYNGEAKHIAGIRVGEYIRIKLAIALGEALHHAIDLLRLAGQSKRPKKLSAEGMGG